MLRSWLGQTSCRGRVLGWAGPTGGAGQSRLVSVPNYLPSSLLQLLSELSEERLERWTSPAFPIHGGDQSGFVWVCFPSALAGIASQKWPSKNQQGTNRQQGTKLPSKKFPCAPGGSCIENTDPGGEPKFPGSFPTLCFPSGPRELPPRGPSGEGAVPFLQMFGVFPWISPSAPQPPGALGCPQPCLCR